MKFQNALDNARVALLALTGALVLSFITNLFLSYGLMTAPDKITVHIPPHIPDEGVTQKANDIPQASVYSFAFYIWQQLNYWPANGAQDYRANLTRLAPFLTPRFSAFLLQDYNQRLNQGELQSRMSTLQGLNGEAFELKDVEYIGHGTWLVHLNMRLMERMNINDQTVKDTQISYVLRVVRYSINAKENPWGLAIDGFAHSPERLKTTV